ncbi:uncharacterized protein LOC106162385 isoform X1 [Lingula anatina]|uniref:Uncharacterized protein LOC106162385 isoform X1 n=1 Tax=Lingula anatina TaxID=7574 RepID=A0A1S3IAD6_LINAN|nr:uncharacterized protein LOC106162385 isoform X1 [Lingula anatina]|eukprot:XP_013395128.1 uncharacterized protein LOC106162385 isoform X1 [Lingula anatina]
MAETKASFGVPEGCAKAPAFHPPNIEQLRKIAGDLGLELTDEELAAYREHMLDLEEEYGILDELAEPTLPVKYPRTPGWRPKPEDNPFNGWYWRTDIQGAPSGKLAGKTLGIKDNTAVAGVPMMNGSRVLEGYMPEFDATVVTRILDAGGRILGKTAVEDLCVSGSSFTSSKMPVLNPYDATLSTAGSSAGSGALVAGGQIDMALGGDQGGSIRLPASWCGIVGLKPTWGLVPYTGISVIHPCIDHAGPMTRTVEDCALMLEVIAGYDDGLDPRQQPNIVVPEYSKLLNADLAGMKVGVVKEGFDKCQSTAVDSTIRSAMNYFKAAGASVEDVSIPMHITGRNIAAPIIFEGCYETMVQGGAVAFGFPGFYPTTMQQATARGIRTHLNDVSHTYKMVSLLGEYTKQRYNHIHYARAMNCARLLRKAYDDALANYDVLVMPTIQKLPQKLPPKGSSIKESIEKSLEMLSNTAQFDVTHHPALSINAGFADGLPVGLMIVGKHFDETTVLKAAYGFEKKRDEK